jgi:hypothetical protein
MIPASQLAKTVHASDRAVIVIGVMVFIFSPKQINIIWKKTSTVPNLGHSVPALPGPRGEMKERSIHLNTSLHL